MTRIRQQAESLIDRPDQSNRAVAAALIHIGDALKDIAIAISKAKE